MRLSTCTFLVCLAVATPGVLRAQATAEDMADSEAQGLFHAATAAFEAGRYESALEYFERAYELSGRPALLYNIGHTAGLLQQNDRALEAFEAYLEQVPDAPNRAAVEARLRILRGAEEEPAEEPTEDEPSHGASQAEATPTPEPTDASGAGDTWDAGPPSDDGGGGASGGAVVLLAGGAAAVVAGAVLLGLAAGDAGDVEDAGDGTPWVELEGSYDGAVAKGRAGGVLLAVGAAAAAVGVVWLVAGGGDRDVAVGLSPTGASLRGRF